MRVVLLGLFAFSLSGCATAPMSSPKVSILVDLDPASTERTAIVESITADRSGMQHPSPSRTCTSRCRV
jgi:starvation-inducible outer membrane lipoprotein